MGHLPKLKHQPKPPPSKVSNLRVAAPPAPSVEAPRATREECWALERAQLVAAKAEAESKLAIMTRAVVLMQIDPKQVIRKLEDEVTECRKTADAAKTQYEATIEGIKARLGLTGEFDIDSDTGVITTG